MEGGDYYLVNYTQIICLPVSHTEGEGGDKLRARNK